MSRATPPRARQAGFTLLELMMVVAIIGIATSLGIAVMRKDVKAIDVADQVAQMVREGQRQTVGAGRVRDDVQLAVTTGAARGMMVLSPEAADGSRTLAFSLLKEQNPAAASYWEETKRMTITKAVRVAGTLDTAMLTNGATFVSLAANAGKTVYFYPDGRVASTTGQGVTVYFELRSGSQGKQARTVVMPLGGTATTFQVW